jgi:hypothetical protein
MADPRARVKRGVIGYGERRLRLLDVHVTLGARFVVWRRAWERPP